MSKLSEILFEEFKEIVISLADISASKDDFYFLVDSIGWDAEALFNNSNLNFIIEIKNLLNDLEEIIYKRPKNFLEITQSIESVASKINQIKSCILKINTDFTSSVLQEFAIDFFNKNITIRIQEKNPILYYSLRLLDIITFENKVIISNNVSYANYISSASINFTKVFNLFKNPILLLNELYFYNGFDDLTKTNQSTYNLFNLLYFVLTNFGIEVENETPENLPNYLDKNLWYKLFYYDYYSNSEFGIYTTLLSNNQNGPGVSIVPYGRIEYESISESVSIKLNSRFSSNGFLLTKNGFQSFDQSTGSATISLILEKVSNNSEFFLYGSKEISHLSLDNLSTKFYLESNVSKQDLGAEVEIKNINLLITTENSDSFLNKLLPASGFDADFSLGIGFSLLNGMYFKGSGGIEILLPKHIQLGSIDIQGLAIAIKPKDGKIPIEVSSTIKAELGPLKVVVENIGISSTISFPSEGNGNLGPIDCNLNFKPPTGVALSIDTEGIKGGGFLTINTATGEYRGGLVLGFRDKFTFRAVAIINTRLPGGEPGFSLFVMITADFQPVQLGFGFTLNAVGGLFGYNRTVEVDKLNELVRSGKASQLLFPPADADLPTIVNTAAEVYPVRVGNFVFGPMAKIGWGTPTIVMAEIALIIEVPDPVRVGMLGVIRVVLPDAGSPAPTIRLNMAFFAVVDFAKKMFSLQASLFDSKLLSVTLSGDFAVYMSWGQQRMFIFSAGGFHPAYKEAPPQLASMRRLNLTLIDDKKLKIAATTYLAITSNTVQFGSHIVLWCKFENVQINGQFWFDVLFQFDPFRFQAEMGLIASLSVDKNELAAIRIIGRLNGPGPWYVWGEAYIKVWFIEIKVEVEHSWGEEPPALAPEVVDVKQMLLGEIQKKENWTTVPVPGSAISGISVRDLSKEPEPESVDSNDEAADSNDLIKEPEIVLMPNCLLTFRQKVVPLGIEIQKFGEALPKPGENKFEISGQIAKYDGAVEIHPANELFARANYLALNDEEKLSYPSFEEFKGGITLGLGNNSAVQLGEREEYNYEYELKYLGQDQEKETNLPAFKNMFLQELKGSAAFRQESLGPVHPRTVKLRFSYDTLLSRLGR